MTELNNKTLLETLKSPDLLQIIVNDMKLLGLKLDERQLLLLYLTAVSRLTSRGLYSCFTGIESQTKNKVFSILVNLISPSESLILDSYSPNSFFYELDLHNKCLLISKMDNKGFFATLLKDKKLTHLKFVTVDGLKKAIEKRIEFEGSAFILSDKKINKNLFSLFYTVKLDEKFTDSISVGNDDVVNEIIAKHHAIDGLLKKKLIILPEIFKDELSFPIEQLRYRRDHQRFLNLISAVCFLRQYQKEVKYFDGDNEYIEIDCIDYERAYNIFIHCASQDETFNKDDLAVITKPEYLKEKAG